MTDKKVTIKEMKEFLESMTNVPAGIGFIKVVKSIIKKLEDGQKYKEILKDVVEEAKAGEIKIPNEYLGRYGGAMEYIIKIVKERYFPPEIMKRKRYVNILFPDGENVCIKMIIEKYPGGKIIISNEAEGHLLEKGGETGWIRKK